MPPTGVSFLAMGVTHTATIITGTPPDPSGAAGPNNYVETVNGGIEVFDKSGTVLAAAKKLNLLWAGYTGTNAGNNCAAHNDGDAIVRYDRLADRWLITQFSLPNLNTDSGPSFQCVAVSKTSDPMGAYWLYDFKYAYAVNDYPKIGVWPDAYYATYNMFGTSAYEGADICAWDRTAMLNGQPATQQCFFQALPSLPACPGTQPFIAYSILAANADGSVPPPSGSPEYLMQFDYSQCSGPYNQLDLWKLHIDWTTPANSSLSDPTVLTVSDFTPACYSAGKPNCIPQSGTTTTIDALDDRLMDRLVYRNFGTHESLFLNHTVSATAGRAGIRWYEIRSPNASPSVYQQGTYAPADTNWRWMGSIAADQAGDIGVGYSVGGSVSHPSIAWTGRLGTDGSLGTMTQGESIVETGATNAPDDYGTGRARWGDYSSMTVDPTDDCTFWYANEVQSTSGFGGWDTYVQSFKFPNCAHNDFTIAPPGGVTAVQGQGNDTTVSTTLSAGSAESAQLTAFDLPPGATASFNPTSVTAGGSSTLTLTAGASTPLGTYTVEVAGTAPSAVHATTVSFTVAAGHKLTVAKSGTGAGTVTSNPAGVNCGSTCSFSYLDGAAVTLTATPAAGSAFGGWSGACSGTGSCPLTMSADRSVTATFVPLAKLSVAKNGSGHGLVSSSPSGISCGSTCSHLYIKGTAVTITAKAASGSSFTGWSGACTGAGACMVTMSQARSVTATFALTETLTVKKAGTGAGFVSAQPVGIKCGSICSYPYKKGVTVTLTATPATGSTFTGWSGACTGTGHCTLAMSQPRAVTANFARLTKLLTVSKKGSGTVTSVPSGISCGATCSHAFSYGTVVTLTAKAATGAKFTGWSGACSGTGSCHVTMNAARAVTATFVKVSAAPRKLRR
jgi:List-Bact-rpt repeat protein